MIFAVVVLFVAGMVAAQVNPMAPREYRARVLIRIFMMLKTP